MRSVGSGKEKLGFLSVFPFLADIDCVVPLNSNYLCFELKL